MRRLLTVSWFVIWPAVVLLVGRTIYERACLGLTEPWPWLSDQPLLSLAVGATYIGAHWWLIAWAVARWQGLADRTRPDLARAVAMILILAIDHSPLTPWRWIMRALGC
jgi:hypothetical protein